MFSIDHIVPAIRLLDENLLFYKCVLGAEHVEVPGKPTAIRFGRQKISFHELGRTFEPKAQTLLPRAGDFWLITNQSPEALLTPLAACSFEIESSPFERNGALGAMTSVYFHDSDKKLVEISRYADGSVK